MRSNIDPAGRPRRSSRAATGPTRAPWRLLLVAAVLLTGTAGCTDSGGDDTSGDTTSTTSAVPGGPGGVPGDDSVVIQAGISIEVLSSQPDRISGPDARIRVTPVEGQALSALRVEVDGTDVTGQLRQTDGALEGVVSGLVEGTNTLRAHVTSSPDDRAVQRLRAWPLTGPMISGPHSPLLACSTEAHGLGPATDPNCSAATRVTWRYVNTAGKAVDLSDPASVPADAQRVTVETAQGEQTVPFVLRHETGVVNRSVYDIVTIDRTPGSDGTRGAGADDQADQADQTDQTGDGPDPVWNQKLLYRFGGGCAATYGQGRSLTQAEDVQLLQRGYAVATATFNSGGVQCNDVVSAETAMMVKERVIELLGLPRVTIGEGSSGGTMQMHLIAQNYPGLLDGIAAIEGFADVVTVFNGVADCTLLKRWFTSPAGAGLSAEQRVAVTGFAADATCTSWDTAFGAFLDPTQGCDPAIDPARIYDASTNPSGVRCTIYDQGVNVFGRDTETGLANRPLDNVGVQYGLRALEEGVITFDQFLAVNRGVGGYDADGGHQVDRHEATPDALAAAYEAGRVSSGVGDQNKIPMIQVDVWRDPAGDIHDHVRPFSLRDRLVQGLSPSTAPGLQIWTREPATPGQGDVATTMTAATLEAVDAVDRWLDALAAGEPAPTRAEELHAARPDDAIDNCLVPGATEPELGVQVWDEDGPCRERYPTPADPRMVAGAPLANDVLKCRLKPVDPADYPRSLTTAQYNALVSTFPQGVCDWTMPGAGQTVPSMSDRSFEDVVTPDQLA